MSKDQAIGASIFLICLAIAIVYIVTLLFPAWLGLLGIKVADAEVRFWTIATPVFIAFLAIMGIGAWIGWTMATTPPPKPIEEITSEIDEEKKEATEEK
ncbi:MAG: transcriptional regulator [Candidatus Bathyarchaeia archaeon]